MTTFLIVGAIGLAVLAISFVLGDLFGGVFDALTGDIFSAAVLGGFTAAFGFSAAIAQNAGLGTPICLAVGGLAGLVASVFTLWLTRLVKDAGSDATLESHDALGRSGRVISAIPDQGYGSVRVLIGGHAVQLNARAERPIEPGTEIHVTEIISPTAVQVAPVWNDEFPTPTERP